MTLYLLAIAVHVVVAVLGVGLVGAVPLVARFGRRSPVTAVGSDVVLGALLRTMQIAFVVMLVTGGLLDLSVNGAFHRTTWFRASIAALAVIGLAHARARNALKRWSAASGPERERALAQVERWGWTMGATIAIITLLMQLKPFR